jgi:hypothetical protein
VFLDFDGVVMTLGSYQRFRADPPSRGDRRHRFLEARRHMDDSCVQYVAELCRHADADVVLSTAWRTFLPLRTLRAALSAAGLDARVLGRTPDLASAPRLMSEPELDRGHEIRAWLDRHRPGWTAEGFVVLDDNALGEELTEGRWVRSDFGSGFGEPHLREALALFGVSP